MSNPTEAPQSVPDGTKSITKFTAEHGKEIGLPSPEAINYMMSVAKLISNSAMVGKDVQFTEQQVAKLTTMGFSATEIEERETAYIVSNSFAKMLVGLEFNPKIPPIAAQSELNIVKGQIFVRYPVLVQQIEAKGYKFEELEHSHTRAAIRLTKEGESPKEYEFTIEDARKAKLDGSEQYQKRPRVMLFARCVSEAYRATGGRANVYTPEERREVLNEEESQSDNGKGSSPFKVGEKPKAIEGVDANRVIDMKTEQKEAVPVTNGIPKQDTGNKAAAKDEGKPQPEAAGYHAKETSAPSTSPAVAPETEGPVPEHDDPNHPHNQERKFVMLQKFGEQKKRLGEALYYQLIKEHSGGGAKRSIDFISLALATYVHKQMKNTPTPEAGPDYKAEVSEALAKISETRNPGKSVQANSKPFGAFMKGFMGGPLKPTAESIGDIRMGLRLLDSIMASDKAMILDKDVAEKTGHIAAEGYAKSLNYLKGRSAIVPMAFWELVIDRGFALTGGSECLDYFTAAGIPADAVDSELMAFMQVAMRTREAAKLVDQSKATGVPMAKIITGWGIDIEKAPVVGIDSLLNGFKAPPAQVEQSDAAEPPVESTKVDEAPWGLDLFAE